jgi:hypothetical protein
MNHRISNEIFVILLYRWLRKAVSDGKRSGVSGSIRTIKMYSCAKCAMQERSMCCRDVPVWPIWSRDLASSTLSTSPLPYLPGYWGLGLLLALNKDEPGQWSGHLRTAQPRTCGPWKVYVNIVLYFTSSSNTVF